MSDKLFNEQEIQILRKNIYVKNITAKGITYTDEFKKIFIQENLAGSLPRDIFEKHGLHIEYLGMKRIKAAGNRWRSQYILGGTNRLQDTRKLNSGRPTTKDLSLEEKYKKLQEKIEFLEAENEFFKKVGSTRKGRVKTKVNITTSDKYKLIQFLTLKRKLTVTLLCKLADVSRSGYYKYISKDITIHRNKRELNDNKIKEEILLAFHFKNRRKGARQIKMILENEFSIIYNLKRIRRIMKKFNIICPIRKANPYRRMMKANKEHTVLPNILNREFKQNKPGKVLLTDITYLKYGKGTRAYLSTIKDASSNEILAYKLSDSLKIDIVTDTIKNLSDTIKFKLPSNAFIHSDQGAHYTSPIFQKLLKKNKIGQSMSRRGNCWDNAPQESFFGHMKDECDIKDCISLEELQIEIDNYMDYYNNYRPQWNLKKMTPVQYRNHLLSLDY
ncbi:IS3 family transposase [Cetobacterium sp.]|uniref:IS3 family transposase n=1 Tax=Cetobacterium sp. TaxID=2071632 RepID=UPI003EE58C50